MNAAPNVFLLTEPLFYGEKTRTQGCTAEEFVTRVDAQRLDNGWTQRVTAVRARGFMRDAAHSWCEHALPAIHQWDADRLTEIRETWDGFKKVFKETYFTVNTATDLAVDWTTLKQLPTEDALMFANRVASTLHRYQDLLVSRPHPEAERQRLSDAIEALHGAAANAGTRQQNAEATEAMEALMEICQARGRASVITDIIIRLTCDGVTDRAIQVAVKKRELEGTTVHEVQETIKMVMKSQAGRLTTANKEFRSNPNAPHIPKTTAATEVVSSEGEGTETAAVAGKGKKKSRKERRAAAAAAKALEQAAVAAPKAAYKKKFDFSKPPPDDQPCYECHRSGHWGRYCPFKKQMMAEFMQRANVNSTTDPAGNGGHGYGGGVGFGSTPNHGSGSSYGGGPSAPWSGNANAGW
jgi:hypothetical protein